MSTPGQRLNSIRERLALLSQIDPKALFTPDQLQRRKKLYSYPTPCLRIPPIQRFIKQKDQAPKQEELFSPSNIPVKFESVEIHPSENRIQDGRQNQEKPFEVEVVAKVVQKNGHQKKEFLMKDIAACQIEEKKQKSVPLPQNESLNFAVKINANQAPHKQEQQTGVSNKTTIEKSKESIGEHKNINSTFQFVQKIPESQKKEPFKLGQIKKTNSFQSYPQQKNQQINRKIELNKGPFQKISNSQQVQPLRGSNNLFSGSRIQIIENNNHRISSSQIIMPQSFSAQTESLPTSNQPNKPNLFFKQKHIPVKPSNVEESMKVQPQNEVIPPIPEKRINIFARANEQQQGKVTLPINLATPGINFFKKNVPEDMPNVSKIIPNQVHHQEVNKPNPQIELKKDNDKKQSNQQAVQPKKINIFSRKPPEPKEETKPPQPMFGPVQTNIFTQKEINKTNIFKRQAPSTNIFKASSAPTNVFTNQPNTFTPFPSNVILQSDSKSEKLSNIFTQGRQTNIFSKSQQIPKTTNIFGQKSSQPEATQQEGEDDNNSQNQVYQQEQDKYDPNLSTGTYNYVNTNVIFKASASKCRIESGQLIQNVVISLEQFDKPDVFLYIRMSNKCIKLCAKILKGVTSIIKIGQNPRNVAISRLLNMQNANPAQPKLTTIKIQFSDQKIGELLVSKGFELTKKIESSAHN